MSKHTPGPWYVQQERPWYGQWLIVIPDGAYDIPSKYIASIFQGSMDWQETKANTKLIAAAPDLLAACQLVNTVIGDANGMPEGFLDRDIGRLGVYLTPHEIRTIKAAIAKATANDE